MPLLSGKSKKVIQRNIAELMHKFNETGTIGNSRPKNKKEAIKQAVAIAYSKARESTKKGRKS